MASRTGGLIQDQNLNVHYNGASAVGKANISKAPRKAGIGGRKPLGDLSNSVNPTPNQTSKKENSKIFPITETETCTSKVTLDSSKRKSVSKASEKVQAGGGRKALSDISNADKPHLQEISKKNNQTAKLTILADDPSQPKNIAEEGFLHNHEECIKAQKRAISMNEFLPILGLEDFSKQSSSAKEPPMSNKMMHMSPPRYIEPREMTELLVEDLSPPNQKMSKKLDSAPPSPEPLDHSMHWDDPDYILVDDPSQPKDIAEEGFLHNHEECIKAHKRAISMNEFLPILGLEDFSKQSASAKEPPMSNKMMHMSPPRYIEPREMTELLVEDLSPPNQKMSKKLDSAPPSPELLDHSMHWDDPDYIPSLQLIESP